jgi:hypothetical protein
MPPDVDGNMRQHRYCDLQRLCNEKGLLGGPSADAYQCAGSLPGFGWRGRRIHISGVANQLPPAIFLAQHREPLTSVNHGTLHDYFHVAHVPIVSTGRGSGLNRRRVSRAAARISASTPMSLWTRNSVIVLPRAFAEFPSGALAKPMATEIRNVPSIQE